MDSQSQWPYRDQNEEILSWDKDLPRLQVQARNLRNPHLSILVTNYRLEGATHERSPPPPLPKVGYMITWSIYVQTYKICNRICLCNPCKNGECTAKRRDEQRGRAQCSVRELYCKNLPETVSSQSHRTHLGYQRPQPWHTIQQLTHVLERAWQHIQEKILSVGWSVTCLRSTSNLSKLDEVAFLTTRSCVSNTFLDIPTLLF